MSDLNSILRLGIGEQKRHVLLPGEGVMTASDQYDFVGLQLLYSSIVMYHQNSGVAVIDLGLTPRQKNWCLSQPGLILISPSKDSLKMNFDVSWNRWNKPYFLLLSPFQKTIWLNATSILLKSLQYIFSIIDDEPFIVESHDMIPVTDKFYENMPGQCLRPKASYPKANVIGINIQKDFWLLRDWMWAVENISLDKKIKSSCCRLEEGCLAWVLAKNNKSHLPTSDITWNYPSQDKFRSVYYKNASELLIGVTSDHPYAKILEWRFPSPWNAWKEDFLEIYPHLAVN
jgi:hypothetical protein